MLDARITQPDGNERWDLKRQSLPSEYRARLTMTPREVGGVLGRSPDYIRGLCRDKELLSKKHNKQFYVDVNSVLLFLDRIEEQEVQELE